MLQVDSFLDYLLREDHPKGIELLKAKPKAVKLEWLTKCMGKDSGVFVMRHMETYLGRGVFSHSLNKEEEGLKKQVNNLRIKFLSKMILLEINVQRKTILKEENQYAKKETKTS